MSYERRALVVCCRIHSLILWQLSVNWIRMGHYLVALTLSNNTMFTSSFMITDQLFFSVSRDAEIIWFVLNAELDAQTVIFRRRKSLIQNLGTDCWYWCDSRVHDGNIEFQKRDKGSWSLFTVIRYTVTCTWLQIECVWPWHPPPFVSESRNNMVPKATHMFTHW